MNDFENRLAFWWGLVFWASLVFLINEIITKSHVASSFTESIQQFGVAHKINRSPTFSFDNPNHLAVYLVLTIAILSHYLWNQSKYLVFFFSVLFILLLFFLIESRLAFFALFIMIGFICLYHKKGLIAWLKNSSFKTLLTYSIVFTIGCALLAAVLYNLNILDNQEKHAVFIDQNIGDSLLGMRKNFVPSPDVVLFTTKDLGTKLNSETDGLKCHFIPIIHQHPIWIRNKLMFPLVMVGICLFGALLFYLRKISYWKVVAAVSGLVGIFLIGIYIKHPLMRVNEKWQDHVLVEKSNVLAVQDQLNKSNSNPLVPISIQYETSQALMNGQSVDLKALDPTSILVQQSRSGAIRKNLLMQGISYLKASSYLGTGAGSFTKLASNERTDDSKALITSPHSLFIEIFVQYGLLIGCLFLLVLVYPLFVLVTKALKHELSAHSLLLFLCWISFMVMCNANSASLPLPVIWFNFSLIVIFTGRHISPKPMQE